LRAFSIVHINTCSRGVPSHSRFSSVIVKSQTEGAYRRRIPALKLLCGSPTIELEDEMTPNSGWIGDALLQIQSDFLDDPALTLTPVQAAKRFGIDTEACAAILGALLESGVLAKTPDGAYIRFFPRFADATRRSRGKTRRFGSGQAA
jgi:hypothetical protein